MALSDVSQRCKATSDLGGATVDIGRPYGLDRSVAFDPQRKSYPRARLPKLALSHEPSGLIDRPISSV